MQTLLRVEHYAQSPLPSQNKYLHWGATTYTHVPARILAERTSYPIPIIKGKK